MFVTSDIYDLEKIARNRMIAGWRERLVGSVAFHGTEWPGGKAAAQFLIEAAKACKLQDQLPVAGYSIRWGEPSEHLDFAGLADLARRPGALDAESAYLVGSQGSITSHDSVRYGGYLDATPRYTSDGAKAGDYPYRAFDGDFAFPLDGQGSERAEALLRLAAELLRADYGYFFVRDVLAGAEFYARGEPGSVDRSRLARADAVEKDLWRKFVGEGELWTGVWPQLRDVYAVNLLSERHLWADFETIGHLDQWITAEPGRGRLEAATNGRVLWSLTDAEIYTVRPALWDLALTRTCMPRVYRDLAYARERPDPETCLPNDQISGT